MGRAMIDTEQYGWAGQFRWPLLSIFVGIIAGIGAILLEESLHWVLYHFIHLPTGFMEPHRSAEVKLVSSLAAIRSWLFLLIPTLGGLISGLIVFSIAPEAEGHGTDSMIDAFHHRGGYIRKRVPIVKIIASAITIGSGGSAGKEGPIAQIGAGFASFFASILRLKPRDRRILVLAGAGGAMGAIFHAPLGAALFAPEVLYQATDFEFEAILPCIVSAIVASSVFDQYYGRSVLFLPGKVDFMPVELLPYAIFGVVCACVGFVFVKVFYGSRDYFFKKLHIPMMLLPAVGGFLMGCLALISPPVIDEGYGWVQAAMEGKIFWGTMLILVFMKILATSCTISSGGSGGAFGPSIFIGGMLGGAFGYFGHLYAPNWVLNPAAFVVVGIGGFFAGVAKVPISSIIMASEMCGSYNLLVPLMLTSAISFILLRRTNLYEKQLISRLSSPVHMGEFAQGVMRGLQVKNAIVYRPLTLIPENTLFGDLVKIVTASKDYHFPVVNGDNKMTGILSINDIREVLLEQSIAHLIVAQDVATPNVVKVFLEESLQIAMDKMAAINVDELPVVSEKEPDKIITLLSKRDIISYYYDQMQQTI
jgi:CIC family chloride channel protein